jgi:DMSO reductase anchor subunit
MPNWSLVCFTLSVQSAIGLVWVSILGRWLGAGVRADFLIRPMVAALILSGLGLFAALVHLARPRLAPHAFRNLVVSWLSREVVLVQAFAAAVVLVILLLGFNISSGLLIAEAAACLLGGAALFAMTRVYLLKAVPVWNSPATSLEFAGSAMLLGGALGVVLAVFGASFQFGSTPAHMVPGIAIMLGLTLKLAAVSPTLAAEQNARTQTWYEPAGVRLSVGRMLIVRIMLNLFGLLLVLAAIIGSGPTWLWANLCLVSLATAEILGRQRFYKSYRRMGL